ncbi:MAG: hypothetical protein AAGH64_11295, partial [Planctomycetota bacterium]
MPGRPDQPGTPAADDGHEHRGMVPLPETPFTGDGAAPRTRPAQPGAAPGSPPPAEQRPALGDTPAPSDHAGRPAVCPYCAEELTSVARCASCKGMLDPLSRQASQNAMGPWAIAGGPNARVPGCSFATLRTLIARGRVTGDSVLRGPTTRQFWMRADHAPGVAALLGICHACKARVQPSDSACASCEAALHVAPTDRQHLGLSEVNALPGEGASTTDRGPAPSAMRTIEVQRLERKNRRLGVTVGAMGALLVVVGGVLVWQQLEQRGYALRPLTAGTKQSDPVGTPAPGTGA